MVKELQRQLAELIHTLQKAVSACTEALATFLCHSQVKEFTLMRPREGPHRIC